MILRWLGGDCYRIAEKDEYGNVIAFYRGYYKHRHKKYVLYPERVRISSRMDLIGKKSVSAYDVR